MAYRHGRTYWGSLWGRDGRRKRVSLGTDDHRLARDVEGLLRRLAGRREWALLDAVTDGHYSAGELYDAAIEGEQALDLLRARLADVDLNEHIDGWQNWASRRASSGTVSKYLLQVRALIPEGEPYPRSTFTRRAINEALSSLPFSGSTARRYHAAWSSFAKYLVEIEVLDSNPLRSITPPRNNPARELYLSLEDSQRLVDAQREPYRSVAALREGAGVEISAALKVRVRDVDQANRSVHVHGTKNAWRNRPVYVEDWAWEYIARCLKGKFPDSPLFLDGAEPATYSRALASHRAAVKRLQLPVGYTMHDARHSFAVRQMKAGVDPQLIANNLGHRDATMVLKLYGKYRVRTEDFRRLRTGT